MKIRHILLVCSAAAMPQLATADHAVTNPGELGQMHALVDFCTRIDPQNSDSFRAEWHSIVGGQSQIEQNSAYKQQYAALTSQLAKLPWDVSQAICTLTAEWWNGTAGRGHGGDGDGSKDNPGKSKPGHEADR